MVMKFFKQFHSVVCFEWPQRLLFLRALLVIVGGFTVNLTLSAIWTFGNMEPYIVSYIRNRSHPTDLRMTIGPWVFTATITGQGTAVLLGGWLNSKLGPRLTSLLGGWTLSAGVLLSYFTIQTSFWLFILTYGIMVGIGVGIAYVSPLSAAMKWMPNWKGVANGFMLAGYGVGILLFDVLQTTFANPHNDDAAGILIGNGLKHGEERYFTDAEVLDRIPYTFLVLGGSYAVLQLLGSLLLTDPPEQYVQQQSVRETSTEQDGATHFQSVSDERVLCPCIASCFRAKKIEVKNKKKNPSFLQRFTSWLKAHLSVMQQPESSRLANFGEQDSDDQSDWEEMQLLKNSDDKCPQKKDIAKPEQLSMVPCSVANHQPFISLQPLQMLKQLNFYLLWVMFMLDGIAATYMMTYYKVFGLASSADDHFLAVVGAVSALCDTIGGLVWGLLADKLCYKVALILLNATFTVFLLTLYVCTLAGKVMFTIWICVLWFCIAGIYTIFPTAVARSFGLKYVSTNYPLLFTSQILASVVTSLIDTFLYNRIFMYGAMFLVSGLTFISLILAMFYKPKKYILPHA